MLGMPWQTLTDKWHYYFVTNKHIVDGNCLAVRLNVRLSGAQTLLTVRDDGRSTLALT